MPYWYYNKEDLNNTPSTRDGVSVDSEKRYRREGARFIINIGSNMGLGYNTVATGVAYFHRFYMFHSFKTFPTYVTACCCLFLAGKVEETPKKCKDIIMVAESLLTKQKFASFGEDPKEEVMTLERILLQTIKFDLQVEQPYCYLLKYAKCLKGDRAKLQKMVQMAWTFINDSLCTMLCLQWEPEVIAVALMYLASKMSQFIIVDWKGRTPKHKAWWDMFVEGLTVELLEDICHQAMDLYIPRTEPIGGNPTRSKLAIKLYSPTKPLSINDKTPSIVSTSISPVMSKPSISTVKDLDEGKVDTLSEHPRSHYPPYPADCLPQIPSVTISHPLYSEFSPNTELPQTNMPLLNCFPLISPTLPLPRPCYPP